LADEFQPRYLLATVKDDKTAVSARCFLKAVHDACSMKIAKLLTYNGKEFTDRLFASRERKATGQPEFGRLCAGLDIEH